MSLSAKPQTSAAPNLSWRGFVPGNWVDSIAVRDFIQHNYQPYDGDAHFLSGATERTTRLWAELSELFTLERAKGVLDVSQIPSSITAHTPGYIDRNLELIVGLQTEQPLRRAIFPYGGWRMVESSLESYDFPVDPQVRTIFTSYRKTHNDGVFDVYTPEILRARKSHIVTGLPDAYGRGRIIGDYRRVALYGVDRLIVAKHAEKASLDDTHASDEIIRDREELAEQIRALDELKEMAASYGYDIAGPAATAREAIQWTYFAYLAAVKEQNGAAMSLGRTSTFLDIYIERDLREGRISEVEAQELIDDFVIKLRIVRFLRTREYDTLFSGDPTW
ncbi:MAG: formate acetyltransferase, partial [Oscillochloris sp.]|nr:formate acetyltransferase [Oscillochloris sp.]